MRFREISIDDKLKIRKERRRFFWFLLGVLASTNIYHFIFYPNRTPNMELMGEESGKAIAIILILLGISSAVVSAIALKKVTRLIYQNPRKYFILYFALILFGFAIGIALWIAVIIIGLETKKVLKPQGAIGPNK
ncbi:hypothetical protein EPN16_04790 [bacterium]|nr:MAG: hypothetical protein EPN16_04790 [bacterium]